MSRIALVRHGRSAHVHSGWVDHDGLNEWRAAYETAGVHEDEAAPSDVIALLEGVDLFASSDTPRALESARLLAGNCDVVTSPLLRERDLTAPRLGNLRLPLGCWGVAIGFAAFARSMRSPAERDRAADAAQWLIRMAADHDFIAVVTHASFRRLLAASVERAGWHREISTGWWRHWSVWVFRSGERTVNA